MSKDIQTTLKFIFNLLKPYRLMVIGMFFLSILAAAGDVVIPVVYGRLLDAVTDKSALNIITMLLLTWLILRLVIGALRRHIALHGNIIGWKVSLDFRTYVEGKILDLPLSFHYSKRSQNVSESLGNLRWDLTNFIEWGLFDLGPAILASVAMMIYVSVLDTKVAIALFAAFIVFFISAVTRSDKFLHLLDETDKQERKTETRIWDAIRNILVVKSFEKENTEREILNKEKKNYYIKNKIKQKYYTRTVGIQDTIATLGILGALSFAAFDVYIDKLTAGQFLSIVGYAYAIFSYIMFSNWQFLSLLKVASKYKPVNDILKLKGEDYESGEDIKIKGDIEFRRVRFRYRQNVPILKDINFKVRAGAQIAIVGESGEGKTTIVELLARYIHPQSGAIYIDGKNVRDANLRSLRRQIAYVPQDITLFHDTIDANIRYSKQSATNNEVKQAARLAHLHEFISKLPKGYNTVVGERGLKLSAGERQRVALARAFLRAPRILVLDEPTSNLDSKTEEMIRASLEKLMSDRTTLIIAHRLRTVRTASKILVLKGGRIVEQGNHDELVKRDGVYKSLLDAQSGVLWAQEEHL